MINENEDISTFIQQVSDEQKNDKWSRLNEEQRFDTLMKLEAHFLSDALRCFDGSSPVLFQFSDEHKIALLNKLANTYPTQMRRICAQRNEYRESLFDFFNEENHQKVATIIQKAAENAHDLHIKMAAKRGHEHE